LTQAKVQIDVALEETQRATLDIVTSAMRDAWATLGEITGTSAQESIIDRIYSKFCLGK
jgi:tRNA modification GTPase